MLVLLLGSYDPETKKLLYGAQKFIAQAFSSEGHYALIMENLEYFVISQPSRNGHGGTFDIIVEKEKDVNLTLYFPRLMGNPGSILVETISYRVDVPGALFEYLFNKKLISEDAKIMNMPALAPVGQPSLFSVLVESCSLYFIIRLFRND